MDEFISVARCLLPWSWLIPCCKVSGSCSSFIPYCKVSGFLILLWSVLHGVWFPNPSLIRVARCLVSWSFFISCSKVFGFLILLFSVLQGAWSHLFVLHGVWFPWSFIVPCCMVTGSVILLYSVSQGVLFPDPAVPRGKLKMPGGSRMGPVLFSVKMCLVLWYCSFPSRRVSGSCLVLLFCKFVWFSNPAEFRLVHVWKVYVPCRNVFNEILWSCCVSFRNVVLFSDPAVLHFASCLVL